MTLMLIFVATLVVFVGVLFGGLIMYARDLRRQARQQEQHEAGTRHAKGREG